MKPSYSRSRYISRRRGGTKGSSGRGSALPRKGRIRAVLLVLIAAFLIYWSARIVYSGNESAPSDTAPKETTVAAQSAPDTTAQEAVAAESETAPPEVTASEIVPEGFLTEEEIPALASVMGGFRPEDTLVWKDRSVQVFTSLETSLNKLSRMYMQEYRPRYGAVVVFQPRTGRVLGLHSYVNPDNDSTVQSLDMPLYTNGSIPAASIAKIISATAALEVLAYTSRSRIAYRGKKHTLYKSQIADTGDFPEEVSLRRAFAESLNPVFGSIGAHRLGANNLMKYAQSYGFNTQIPFVRAVDSSRFPYPDGSYAAAEHASGFTDSTTMSPLHGALIAGAVANKGVIIRPRIIDSVRDIAADSVVFRSAGKLWRRAFRSQTYDDLNILMKDVTVYGTARTAFRHIKNSPRFDGYSYGGKTGSIDMDGRGGVDWFIGYLRDSSVSRNVACAVLLVNAPRWRGRSSYIGAELMRRHIMALQKRREQEKIHEEQLKQTKDTSETDHG
ncbi:MAG: penicillin-binding transpeptidase domain-containing protein [Fibrobacterota bacterium]